MNNSHKTRRSVIFASAKTALSLLTFSVTSSQAQNAVPKLEPTPAASRPVSQLGGTIKKKKPTRGVTHSTILVGQTISLSGGKNPYAAAAAAGIKLFTDEANAKGGVFGRRISYVVLDDNGKADIAKSNAETLVGQDVFMLFGALEGGPANAVAKVAQARQIVFLGPMAGAPELRQPHMPFVFPVRAAHRAEFQKILRYGETVGATRVAFLHSTSPTGMKHLINATNESKAAGVTLVASLPYKDDASDEEVAVLIAKARDAGAQLIFNHGLPKLFERFILGSRKAGFQPIFAGVNSGSSEVAGRLGSDGKGVIFAQVVPNPDSGKFEVVRQFKSAWLAAYPGRKTSHGALEGYLTAKVLFTALRRAGPDPTQESLITGLHASPINLGGLQISYSSTEHQGMDFVELSLVGRDGKFVY